MERSTPKQRPVSTQRSMSMMTIDTTVAQNAYTPQLRRNHSVVQPRPRSVYSSEPVMSSDELTEKIADSFQQFSSMLNQMQKTAHKKEQQPHSPALSRPTTPSSNRGSISKCNSDHKLLSTKNDCTDKTTFLSPVSLFSPPLPLNNHSTARIITPQLPQHLSVSPLDSTQSHKDIPRAHKEKRTRMVQDKQLVNIFLRAASNGDTHTLQNLLQQCRDLAYVADDDDEGPTALIYAACFGHLATVQSLLEANAPIDEQDNFGWTALMWASVNHHDAIVELLLSKGAAPETQSIKGNTAFDFVLKGDTVMTKLLQAGSKFSRRHHVTVDRKVKRKKSKQLFLKTARRQSTPVMTTTATTATNIALVAPDSNRRGSKTPSFQHSGMDAYTHFMTAESTRQRLLTQRHELFHDTLINSNNGSGVLSTAIGRDIDIGVGNDDDDDDDDDDNDDNDENNSDNDDDIDKDLRRQQQHLKYEASMRSSHTFVWDTCLVDQMFVFSMDHLGPILDVVLDTKTIPKLTTTTTTNKDEILWMPANLLFLCARFAYYYTGRGDLAQFFDITISRITKAAKQCAKDTHLLCYWMANIYQLLNYLKRDTGLERNTQKQQRQLADLMADQYTLFIRDCERRLDKVIDPAFLDYQSIQDMLPVDFADANDWSKFFRRRGSTRVSMDSNDGSAISASTLDDNSKGGNGGPQTIISLLEGIQDMMTEVYELPTYMAKHTMVQCVFYVLCEGFNQLLANKKYLCRSKALHIRMNVSVLEEWARKFGYVDSNYGTNGLERMTQLLQLLQCLSELGDLDVFRFTCQGLALLNAVQIKRCVFNYRYETQETHLPKYVEEWVTQWTQQQQQCQQASDDLGPAALNSIQHLGQLKDYLMVDDHTSKETTAEETHHNAHDPRDKSTSSIDQGLFSMDTRSILPFNQPQAPTQTLPPLNDTALNRQQHSASSESIYLEIKQKAEQQKKETSI
ncbi:hypothetical protein BCR42DRAFT_420097, partial [Absidia repens]